MNHIDFDTMNALAPAAQQGDPDALNGVTELGYQWVTAMILKRRLWLPRPFDLDDLAQEGMRGFYEALRDWQPVGNAHFSGFAKMCIERELITAIKHHSRMMRRAKQAPVSLDAPAYDDRKGEDSEDRLTRWDLPDPSGLGDDPADLVAGSEAETLQEALLDGLTPLEREAAMRCLLQGQSYRQAAAEMGCGVKSIDNAVQRTRRIIKMWLPYLATWPGFTEETRGLLRSCEGRRFYKCKQSA